MKRILIVCCAVFIALAAQAQSFSWTNGAGTTFDITITDATNKYAKITRGESVAGTTEITVPGSVPYNGNTYTVTEVAGRVTSVNGRFFWNGLKKITLSEGIRIIRSYTVHLATEVEEVVFPSTLELLEREACTSLGLKHIDLSNTNVRYIGPSAFIANSGTIESVKFPQTLRRIEERPFYSDDNGTPLKSMTLPAQLDTIAYTTFHYLPNLEEITFEKPTPALFYINNPLNPSEGPFDPFRDSPNLQKIYVPVDAAKAYMDAPWWKLPASKYREKLTIGSNGYSTYYLENENFKVPTGCTAYIITDVQAGATATDPYRAVLQTIAAGSIIPKQTGFILQGTAGSTVEYEANVTGTEVNVAGNLLVGTATDAVFNESGYKYFLFGHKGTTQGFYWQTGRNGASISLKTHKAGLKIPTSKVPFAKSFVLDFSDELITGIRNVDNAAPQKDAAIYDLQGRRVTNPTRGIYIVNGKKQVFN